MNKAKNIIFDIETLGTAQNTCILTLAAIPFDLNTRDSFDELLDRGFYCKLDVKDQMKNGRTYDEKTLKWWKEQSLEARQMNLLPTEQDLLPAEALTKLNNFIEPLYDENTILWCRGLDFDKPKLEHIYSQYEIEMFLRWWKWRDIRTFVDCLTGSIDGKYPFKTPENFIAHNCLYDCVKDVMCMQEIWSKRNNG